MNASDSNRIALESLESDEQRDLANLEEWIRENPQAQWKQGEKIMHAEQCQDKELRRILQRLTTQEFISVSTFRTRASDWILRLKNGELIPISPCEGCNFQVGKEIYPLLGGTKVRVQAELELRFGGFDDGYVLYLLWKQRK